MKKFAMLLVLALLLCGCSPSVPVETDTTTKFTGGGFNLSVPNEYVDLLFVDTTVYEDNGNTFLTVREKASVEAAREMWPDDETMTGGFLFSIGCVDASTFHEMMIWGMTGADVFARDGDGNYYIYYHPTDVQLLRVGDYTDGDWEQWSELCQWAAQTKQSFVADNPTLTAYERTYSDVDGVLHYLAYGDGAARLIRKGGDAVYTPGQTDSMPYLEQLLDDVMFYTVTSGDFDPEGDCIALSTAEIFDNFSFDFFIGEGQQQYIRQNFLFWDDMQPVYYAATRNGQPFPAGKVVADWLNSIG